MTADLKAKKSPMRLQKRPFPLPIYAVYETTGFLFSCAHAEKLLRHHPRLLSSFICVSLCTMIPRCRSLLVGVSKLLY